MRWGSLNDIPLSRTSTKRIDLRHEMSNNVVCATSKASDQPVHMHSLIRAFASRLNNLSVKPLDEHHLEFLSLTGGCTGLSESALCQIATLSQLRCSGDIVNSQ